MAIVNKNDVNQIFAENAPPRDKPAEFQNYTAGWDTSRQNNGKPTIKQFNYLQQRTDQNILYIHQRGAMLPYDENIQYASGAVVIKDGAMVQWDGSKWNGFGVGRDSGLVTWSGRSQEQKNKDNISALDYKATGDGSTNDTQAFTGLELEYTDRIIDLLGKTYAVSSIPKKNTYINGFFKVGNLTVNAKGDFRKFTKTSVSPFSVERDAQLNYSPRHILTRADGSGSGSVVQSFCIDHVNRYMYTLTATTPPFVCRYNLDASVETKAIDKTVYSEILGHQGLDVEYLDNQGNTLIWTSHAAGTGAGGKAIAFKYKADPNVLDEYEEWTLLRTTVSESITPSISFDQRYLLARFQSQVSGQIIIRVFDMQDVKKQRALGNYDISDMYLLEFSTPRIYINGSESVQDLACDGNYIYILWGTFSRDTADMILTFDMSGNMINTFDTHNVGLAESQAATSSDNQHEPESLCFTKNINGGMSLLYGVSFGNSGSRKFTVYELGGDTPLRVTTKDRPAFMAESRNSVEYAVAGGKAMSFGTYSATSGTRLHMTLDSAGRLLKGVTTNTPIDGNVCGFQWHSTDTQAFATFGRWATSATQAPRILMLAGSSSTIGDFSVPVSSGKVLGALSFYGADGNNATQGASIQAMATASATVGNVPARLRFSTRDDSGTFDARWDMGSTGNFYPFKDNSYSVGISSLRPSVIYSNTGTINTSDERLKQQFRPLSEREKSAALEIKKSICLFKFNDAVDLKGDGARWHCGVKAQEVVSIMESHGLNPFEYGFICFDEWDAKPAIVEQDGTVSEQAKEAGSRYAIRYDELAMFILSSI